jgi:hypothetical protein
VESGTGKSMPYAAVVVDSNGDDARPARISKWLRWERRQQNEGVWWTRACASNPSTIIGKAARRSKRRGMAD